MTAIILAGGKSSRFGRDKAFVKIEGIPIIKRQIKILAMIFKKIIIVTNSPRKYRLKGVKIIQDIIPDKGPLGGLYSGLRASDSIYNFVVACDMPFLNERLVKYMIKNIKNFDVFIPKIDNKLHPLCGIYSKNCIPVIEQRLMQDRLKVSGIFSMVQESIKHFPIPLRKSPKVIAGGNFLELKVKFISKKKLQSFDKALLCLENINTLQDLKNINRKRLHNYG